MPVWFIAILGCCWSQYRDRYRRRRFVSEHHVFAVLQGDGLNNPLDPPRPSDARDTRSKTVAYDPSTESPHLRAYSQSLPKALELFDMRGAARRDSADDFHYVPSVRSLGRETRPSLGLEAPKCVEMLQDDTPSCRTSISEVLQRARASGAPGFSDTLSVSPHCFIRMPGRSAASGNTGQVGLGVMGVSSHRSPVFLPLPHLPFFAIFLPLVEVGCSCAFSRDLLMISSLPPAQPHAQGF